MCSHLGHNNSKRNMKLNGILPEVNVSLIYTTMFSKKIIIYHASKYLIMSLRCYWNTEFTSEPILQTSIPSTVMARWRNEEANRMEVQIWENLVLLFNKTKHGFRFFITFSNPLPSLAFFYKRTISNVLVISQNIKILVAVNTSKQQYDRNRFSWDLLLPACLSPVLTQKPVTDFSVVTGTLALPLTYLLCKETHVAWWGILTGCLLFCQLLQFYCYHIGAIMFALGRSIFCIFVHPGWAHTLPTCTAMAQTYQTNIWIRLVSGMSDSLSLLITEIQKQVWYFLQILGRIQTSILPIWAFVNSKPVFSLP